MKYKKRLLEVGILTLVFIVACVVFGYITNMGNRSTTSDMEEPTLPLVSFANGGYHINTLYGNIHRMNESSMARTVTPIPNSALDIYIDSFGNKVSKIKYELKSLDGREVLETGEVESPKDTEKLKFNTESLSGGEKNLIITLSLKNRDIYYYTRVVDAKDDQIKRCLEYIGNFHQSAIEKRENAGVGKAIEPDETGDNTTYAYINIHNTYEQVTYGELEPEVEGLENFQITSWSEEIVEAKINYFLRCKGDVNETDKYEAKESFKIRYIEGGDIYLLDYERTMDQIINPGGVILDEHGINLGITNSDTPYVVNEAGTLVAFVRCGELFLYDEKNKEVYRVFSFSDLENSDTRNLIPNHSIKIIKMEKNGNLTFSVSGYMNRGVHEGRTGLGLYYFEKEENSVTEEAFFDSKLNYEDTVEKYSRYGFYNHSSDTVYFYNGDDFVMFPKGVTETSLANDIDVKDFVTSDTGSYTAYIDNKEKTEIKIRDLTKGKEYKLNAKEGTSYKLLGFIGSDLVYGIVRDGDEVIEEDGSKTRLMNEIVISDFTGSKLKTYKKDNIYIKSVTFKDRMIALSRMEKKGDKFADVSEDYITQNEDISKKAVTLTNYVTDLKETQKRLMFVAGIPDKSFKYLNPKLIISKEDRGGKFY